jgi:hypothetical protein
MFDPNHKVDAHRALVRNALAADATPYPVKLRLVPRTFAPALISDWARAQYDIEFAERVHVRTYNGQAEDCGSKIHEPGCCARHDVLLEMGCLEVWDYLMSLDEPAEVAA